ncbi:MAG: sterol desaturase family protein [Caulobacteraceae bacterium]|nr:sterol desaturase family protein [Caulobacteraceae bacterium]
MRLAPEHIGELWWSDLALHTGRYAVFALLTWAVLWVGLKRPLRGRKIREDNPPAAQMALEFLISMRSVVIFATAAMGMALLSEAGAYPLSRLARHWGPVWFWTSLVLMIIGHDAYYYWSHRAMHHPRLFQKFHRRHHRSHNPSPFSAYSFDLREAALMSSFVILWPLAVPTPWQVVTLFILHQIARNTLAHAGYELMPARANGRPMFDWLTTTTHHDLHHASGGSNFGLYFTWWDRWMGTENPDYYAAFARAVRRPLGRRPVLPATPAPAAPLRG